MRPPLKESSRAGADLSTVQSWINANFYCCQFDQRVLVYGRPVIAELAREILRNHHCQTAHIARLPYVDKQVFFGYYL
jgi:hypothetical protein